MVLFSCSSCSNTVKMGMCYVVVTNEIERRCKHRVLQNQQSTNHLSCAATQFGPQYLSLNSLYHTACKCVLTLMITSQEDRSLLAQTCKETVLDLCSVPVHVLRLNVENRRQSETATSDRSTRITGRERGCNSSALKMSLTTTVPNLAALGGFEVDSSVYFLTRWMSETSGNGR